MAPPLLVHVVDDRLSDFLNGKPAACASALLDLGWRVFNLFSSGEMNQIINDDAAAERGGRQCRDQLAKSLDEGFNVLKREVALHMSGQNDVVEQLTKSFGAATDMLRSAFETGAESMRNNEWAARLHADMRDAESRLKETIVENRRASVPVDMVNRVAELEGKLREATASIASFEVDLHAKDVEIARLTCSNAVKGAVGEREVMEWLRAIPEFSAFEFKPTSSMAACSDFHVVNPETGEFVAVEVKNKGDVRLSDVSKSARDIKDMHERYPRQFVGYVFVSLRSPNIPGKGSVAVEFMENGLVPTLWWGMPGLPESDAAKGAAELKTLFRTLWCLAKNYAPLRQSMYRQDDLVRLVLQAVERLGRCRDAVHNLQQSLRGVKKHADACETECSGVVDLLEHYLADNGLLSSIIDERGGCREPEKGQDTICKKCNRAFKSTRGLAQHKCVQLTD